MDGTAGAIGSWLGCSGASGLADEMVALGDVGGSTGCLGVRGDGAGEVPAEFVQIPAYGVPPVPFADHLAQPVGLSQSGGGAEDMADGDGAAEHAGRVLAYRVIREGGEVVVPGKD